MVGARRDRLRRADHRPAPDTAWWTELLPVLGVLLVTVVVFTWPLAWHGASQVPAGPGAPTVALFGFYVTQWTGQAIEGDGPYWDAPFFHPHRGTFAWSESQPFTSLLVWLLSKIAGPIRAYNLVVFAYLVAGGLAGYALTRQLTEDRVAAAWTGTWLTAGAFTIQQAGVLHLLAFAFPIACLALVLSLTRQLRHAMLWGIGAACALTWLTCAQYGVFLTVLLPFLAVPLVLAKAWSWRTALGVVGAVLLGFLVAAPVLLSQRALLDRTGFERPLIDVRGAYRPADLVLPAHGHWLTTRVLGWSDVPDAYPWDLGVVPMTCLLAAVVFGWLRPSRREALRRGAVLAVVSMSGVALLLGFGPALAGRVAGIEIAPYAWLHSTVPGLSGVRTPSRFGLFALAGIAALGGAALAFLRQRATSWGPRLAVTGAAFALLWAEMWALPIGLTDPTDGVRDHDAVLQWLQSHGKGQALVELPMAQGDSETDLERETRAMLRGLRHEHPTVNGYSGYFPEPYRQIRLAMLRDPSGRGRRYLEAIGTRYVLLHDHDDVGGSERLSPRHLDGEIVYADERDKVIRLDGAAAARAWPTLEATGFQVAPRSGDVLRFPIAPASTAWLVQAPPRASVRIAWAEGTGRVRTAALHLEGSVLVDAGVPWIHVLVQRFDDTGGGAVLLSEERVAERGAPGHDPR